MMKKVILTIALLFSVSSFAKVPEAPAPQAVYKAAAKMKKNDVRTIVKSVMNVCGGEGKSWNAELQVKQPSYNRLTNKMSYTWETVKTINVDRDGGVMEVCAE